VNFCYLGGVQENLNHGRPAKSKLADLIPEAIEIRKQTGETWREIAAKLSECRGVNISHSSLYEVTQTWLKRRRESDALPEASAIKTSQQGRGLSPSHCADFPPQDDFEEVSPKLIVKTRKNR
jgi:hypothetical protein